MSEDMIIIILAVVFGLTIGVGLLYFEPDDSEEESYKIYKYWQG